MWDRVAWAATIKRALADRHLSLEETARRLGVPPTTLRTWLDGKAIPKITVLNLWPEFARIAGVSEVDLLHIAGVLPDRLASSVNLAQATRELRRSLEEARNSLAQAANLSHSSSVAQVVSELSMSGTDWEVRLRSAKRGTYFRMTYHHYVGLVAPVELADWSDSQIRAWVQFDLLAHIWQPLSLYWRSVEAHDWESAPSLVIQVAEQEASRPPAVTSASLLRKPILVFSPPWGYGELFSSLVADAIGYGNIDFRYFGLSDEGAARLVAVDEYLDNPRESHSAAVPPITLLEGLQVTDSRVSRFIPVFLTYGPVMAKRAAEIFSGPLRELSDNPQSAIHASMAEIDRVRQSLAVGSEYVEAAIADSDIVDDGHIDRDRLNDAVARLALAVSTSLLSRHRMPIFPMGGPLRDYFRALEKPGVLPDLASTFRIITVGDEPVG